MRGVTQQSLERRQAVGELLKDSGLTLRDIAARIGVTYQRIQQIQAVYFPEEKRPRRRKPDGPDDDLLLSSASTEEIMAALKVNRLEAVRRRKVARKRHGMVPSEKTFKRRLIAMLRDIGYAWCWNCRQAKCSDEFSPRAATRNGMVCRACNTERQRERYRTSEKAREYCARYQREHAEQQAESNRRYQEKLRNGRPVRQRKQRSSEPRPQRKRGRRVKYCRHEITVNGFVEAAARWLSPAGQRELAEHLSRREETWLMETQSVLELLNAD